MSIKDFFDKFEDSCKPDKMVDFYWTASGCGFGGFYFYTDDDGIVHCGNELMSKEFIKRMLCKMVDDCILDDPSSNDSE